MHVSGRATDCCGISPLVDPPAEVPDAGLSSKKAELLIYLGPQQELYGVGAFKCTRMRLESFPASVLSLVEDS